MTDPVHHLVPSYILERYAAGERRGAFDGVCMFVDISGFSTVTDALMQHGQHGAEVLAEVMRAAFDPLIRIAAGHGAFIATLAGDAFTAIFPLEDGGSEDRALHALAAAEQIRNQSENQDRARTPYGEFTIQVKVGLAAGTIGWGVIDSQSGERSAYYFQGQTIVASGEAEHHAAAGQIVMDAEMFDSVKAAVRCTPVDAFYLLEEIKEPLPEPQAVQVYEPEARIMGRFFPPSLLDQVQSGEFRQVANLFIKLPTVRTEQQLDRFMQSVFVLQDRYGGLLNRIDFGDKGTHLLLFWGAPTAYGNDIGRALNFVLGLQEHTSIPISAGATYRTSHAGFIGCDIREEYTSYGRGVNLAARLMQAAPRGEIWIDAEIARRVGHTFDLESEGKKTFKGFSEPQEVFTLFERKTETGSFFRGTFVGRLGELETLNRFLQPLERGEFCGAMIVFGEAGIGKSRLIDQFRKVLREPAAARSIGFASILVDLEEALWAFCQIEQLLHESFNPFRYWLRSYFEQSSAQSEARNKRSFNRKLDALIEATQDADLADELDRTRSFLGWLIDLQWPDSLYEQLDPQGRYENTLLGLTALVQAESLQQPVVLQLEDAHWLDPDSQAFLEYLFRTLAADEERSYPVALIATARPTDVAIAGAAELEKHHRVAELALYRLDRPFVEELAASILNRPLEGALVDLLADRAAGNPFFVEQILYYLRDQEHLVENQAGLLRLRPGVSPSDSAALPEDIRALLVARLDQLTAQLKELVLTASVLGREFEVRLLAEMLREERQIEERMILGEEQAIWSALDQVRYLFKHGLLRDTAYKMQIRARRQGLHGLAMQALEKLYGADAELVYSELAYHSEQSGLATEALKYLKLAGDQAAGDFQNNQAVDYYTRALAIAPEDSHETRFDLYLGREEVYYWIGNRPAQRADLESLQMAADSLSDLPRRATVALRWARYFEAVSDYPSEIEAARLAIRLGEEAGDQAIVGRGHLDWATGLAWQGRYAEGEEHTQVALALFAHTDDAWGIGESYYQAGEINMKQGALGAAEGYFRQGLEIDRASKNRRRQASILNSLGNLYGHLHDYTKAKNYLLDALESYRQMGSQKGEVKALNNLGAIAHVLGQYPAANDYYEDALQIAREQGDRQEQAIILNNLGEVESKYGAYQDAIKYYNDSLSLSKSIGFRWLEALTLTVLGDALLNVGRLEEAQMAFLAAQELRHDLGQDHLILGPLVGMAQVAHRRGEGDSARELLEPALSMLREKSPDGLEDPFGSYWSAFSLLRALSDPRADDLLSIAHERLQESIQSIRDPASQESFSNNIPEHRKIVEAYTQLMRRAA